MTMSNVWGAGGLFEAAINSKMNAQAMRSETDRMNAKTQLIDTGNRYDIGLRNNDVQKQVADTGQFNGETLRVNGAADWQRNPLTSGNLNGLGLRTFRPTASGQSQPSLLPPSGAGTPGSPTFMGPQDPTAPAAPSSTPQIMTGTTKGGSKYFGSSPMPQGYAKGGVVGNVQNDSGADTVDAKVRPGEFMLNPETVAHIGGGDYESGLRQLNQLVRQATGKEPGPTPVGKSGKPGFADSGTLATDDVLRRAAENRAANPSLSADGYRPAKVAPLTETEEFYRRAALDKMAVEKAAANAAQNAPKPTIHVNSAGVASTAGSAAETGSKMSGLRSAINGGKEGVDIAQAFKSVGSGVAEGAQKAAPMLGKAAKAVALGSPYITPVAAGIRTAMTDTADYNERFGIDQEASHVPQLAKDIGVRALGFSSDAASTMADGALLPYNLVRHALKTDDWASLRDVYRDVARKDGEAATVKEAKGKEAASPGAKARAAGAAEAEAWGASATDTPSAGSAGDAATKKVAEPEFNLRTFLLDRIKANDNNQEFIGSNARARDTASMLNNLAQHEGHISSQKGTMAQLAQQQSKTMDEHIGKTFTKPELDKDGKPTGKDIPDGAKTEAFRKEMADNGIDIYRTDPKTIDGLAREWGVSRGLRDNINKSMNARGGDNVALSEKDFMPVRKKGGVGLGSAFNFKGVTAGDVMSSLNPANHELSNDTLVLPGGQEIAAAEVLKRPDGSYDQDMIDHLTAGEQGLRKYHDMLTQAKKSQKKD